MKPKIAFVVAIPMTARVFLRDHIAALSKEYEVYLLGNICDDKEVSGLNISGWHHIDIERGIAIWKDLKAIWQAKRYFHQMKFDAVHSVTPKAGFVTAVAGWLEGVKHRVHIFTGQVWCTSKGIKRIVLKSIDRIIASLDNHILVDGKSQRSFLVSEGILRKNQAVVFCHGSISGVDSFRFKPDSSERNKLRLTIGIKENTVCFIFLGRLNHDKGIEELFCAYNKLAEEVNNVFLLIVGSDEEGYLATIPKYPHILEGENFHYYGLSNEPEKVLNAGDVFTLPTWREGFGTSVLEAASTGLPCICTNAYGVLDAYVDGETGLQCNVGDSESLYSCMKEMYNNPEMRVKMGKAARERVLRDFKGSDITNCWVEYYHSMLG